MAVRPAKTQISLGIRPVWSESSLSAWRNIGSLATHWAHSKDSDQTGRMPRLILVFAGRTVICWFCGAAAHQFIITQILQRLNEDMTKYNTIYTDFYFKIWTFINWIKHYSKVSFLKL